MDSIIADIMIILSVIVLLAAGGVTAYSVIRSQKNNKRPSHENGVPVRMIGICTIVVVVAIALPTLLFGSITDMCIITSISTLVIASASVVYGRILTVILRKRV